MKKGKAYLFWLCFFFPFGLPVMFVAGAMVSVIAFTKTFISELRRELK